MPSVVDRRQNDADQATPDDERRREVSASDGAVDSIETLLARALARAAAAGRFDAVAQLARELEARRLARGRNVLPFTSALPPPKRIPG